MIEDSMLAKCQDENHLVPVGELIPLQEIEDLADRIDGGETVPSGECRICGSLAHRVTLTNTEALTPKFTLSDMFAGTSAYDLATGIATSVIEAEKLCYYCDLGREGHIIVATGNNEASVMCLAHYVKIGTAKPQGQRLKELERMLKRAKRGAK